MNAEKNALQSRRFTLSEAYAVLKTLNITDQRAFKSKETIIEGLVKLTKTSAKPNS